MPATLAVHPSQKVPPQSRRPGRTGAVLPSHIGHGRGNYRSRVNSDSHFYINERSGMATDALFVGLADEIANHGHEPSGLPMRGCGCPFEQGHFKLKPGDDDSIEVVPCYGDKDQRAAMEQNKPLACYRQRVIEEAGLGALVSPAESLH